jgi:hypothetical protein
MRIVGKRKKSQRNIEDEFAWLRTEPEPHPRREKEQAQQHVGNVGPADAAQRQDAEHEEYNENKNPHVCLFSVSQDNSLNEPASFWNHSR